MPEAASKPRLKAPTLHTLFNTTFPPRGYLMTPWLRQGESAMVWSEPGVGKSMLALSLALTIAGGGTLMGWQAPEARKVLIVDGEMHIEDITERAKMLMATVEGIDPDTAARNITILARQYQDPEADFPDLAEDEGREIVFKKATTGGYDLVILDNFSTLATVEDENAASAFDPVIKFLLKMKQAGVATILVHHSNKTGKDFRGSSKLSTTFEVIMGLLKSTSGEHQFAAAFDLEWTKYRRQRDVTVRGRTAWLEGSPASWKYELSANEEAGELVQLVRSRQFTTQGQLAKALGRSTGHVSKLRWKAIDDLRLITRDEWKDCLEGGSGFGIEDSSPDF